MQINNQWILAESLSKSNFLSSPLPCFSIDVLFGSPGPYSNYKQNRAKESKSQALQLLSTTPYLVAGQIQSKSI